MVYIIIRFVHQIKTGAAFSNPNLIPLGKRYEEEDENDSALPFSSPKSNQEDVESEEKINSTSNENITETEGSSKSDLMASWREKALLHKLNKKTSK